MSLLCTNPSLAGVKETLPYPPIPVKPQLPEPSNFGSPPAELGVYPIKLHWVLDVSFKKDARRGCQGYSAENLAVIRHIGVNPLSQEKKAKVGIENKRLKVGWDNRYLETVLSCLRILTS